MNADELEKTLRKLSLPEVDQAKKARALQKAVYAFKNEPQIAVQEVRSFFSLRESVLAAAFCAVLFLLVFEKPKSSQLTNVVEQPQQIASVDEGRLLSEMLRLFPNELKAVVTNGGSPRLVLGKERSVSSSLPVVIELRKGGKSYKVVSFSGESLDFELGGEIMKFELYVTGDGKVLLVGEDFLWSGDSRSEVRGYHVQAKSLGESV